MSTHTMECSTLAYLRKVVADAQATIAEAQAQIDRIEADDREQTWKHLVAEVRKKRPLIRMWLELGFLLEVSNSSVVIAFPSQHGLAIEQLATSANIQLLEEILSAYLGRPIRVERLEVAE
jgi:Zn-dependent oligopeptidase